MEEIKVSEMLQADSINKDDSVMIIQEGVNKKASGSIQTATGTSLSLTSVADTCKVKSNSKNLFNSDNPKSIFVNGSTIYTNIANGIRVTKTATGVGFILFEIKDITNDVGKTFTLKANFTSTGHYIIGLSDASGGNRISGASTTTSGEAISYTIPEITTSSKLVIWLYGPDGATGDIDYTNIQVEEGSTATDYNPYNTEVILSQNQFDIDNADILQGYFNSTTGAYTSGGNSYVTNNYTEVEQGKMYAVLGVTLQKVVFYNESQVVSGVLVTSGSFAIPTGTKYIRIQIQENTSNIVIAEKYQILTLTPQEEKLAFTYDTTTNLISDGSVTIEYNTQSRLLNNDDTTAIKEYVDREINTIAEDVYIASSTSTGTTSLTFPDISKYKYIDIFYSNTTGTMGNVVRLEPRIAIGKDFVIASNSTASTGATIYLNMNRYTLTATSITFIRRTEKSIDVNNTIASSTSTTETNISINRIIGYK